MVNGQWAMTNMEDKGMKKSDVQKLPHGLYRLYWKSGGTSLAAVGSMPNGDRWMAPVNWISIGTSRIRDWHFVERAEALKYS
jgi:hypothetical protein